MADESKSKSILALGIMVPAAATIATTIITVFAGYMTNQAKATEDRVKATEIRIQAIETSVQDTIETTVKGTADKIKAIETSVKGTADKIKAIETSVKATAKKVEDVFPIGTIIASTLSKMDFLKLIRDPKGKSWVLADGGNIPGDCKYSIFKNTGGKAPDLRGLFLRGAGQNDDKDYQYDEGKEHILGRMQADLLENHNHITRSSHGSLYDRLLTKNGRGNNQADKSNAPYEGSPNLVYSQPMSDFGGSETRPKNMAVNFFIKIN